MTTVTLEQCDKWIADAKWSIKYHTDQLAESEGKLAIGEAMKAQLVGQHEIEQRQQAELEQA